MGLSFWAMWYKALIAFMLNSGGFLSAVGRTQSQQLLVCYKFIVTQTAGFTELDGGDAQRPDVHLAVVLSLVHGQDHLWSHPDGENSTTSITHEELRSSECRGIDLHFQWPLKKQTRLKVVDDTWFVAGALKILLSLILKDKRTIYSTTKGRPTS